MNYGSQPTRSLGDRGRSPKESFPYVYAIMSDKRLAGADGRKFMRKVLGREHETSNFDVTKYKYPVWAYVLRDGVVEAASDIISVDGLPIVYVLGPTGRHFLTIEATVNTTGYDAVKILKYLVDILQVDVDSRLLLQ